MIIVNKISSAEQCNQNVHKPTNLLEWIVFEIRKTLENLNLICFICGTKFLQPMAKMSTCGAQICEFSFKENNLGNIFSEVKTDPLITKFLVETTYMAFFSQRAADLTEPFPSFLLNDRELRPEAGNLEYIKQAQERGTDVR